MKRTNLSIIILCGWFALGLSGCSDSISGASSRRAPSTDVGRVEAWGDAKRIAANDKGREMVIGSGESMRPIYGENTVLVISKIDYSQLKPGMQVAYVSQSGHRVVHVLLEKQFDGWRVQGLNNAAEDRDLVTPKNLIGVVYASFATEEVEK